MPRSVRESSTASRSSPSLSVRCATSKSTRTALGQFGRGSSGPTDLDWSTGAVPYLSGFLSILYMKKPRMPQVNLRCRQSRGSAESSGTPVPSLRQLRPCVYIHEELQDRPFCKLIEDNIRSDAGDLAVFISIGGEVRYVLRRLTTK